MNIVMPAQPVVLRFSDLPNHSTFSTGTLLEPSRYSSLYYETHAAHVRSYTVLYTGLSVYMFEYFCVRG